MQPFETSVILTWYGLFRVQAEREPDNPERPQQQYELDALLYESNILKGCHFQQ